MARSQEEVISEMVDSGLFTDDEIRAAVKTQGPVSPNKGLLRKAWDAASVPSRLAESGITQLSNYIPEPPEPTGNLPLDVALGAPSILSKSGTQAIGKVAASQVDPLSIATAGAARLASLGKGPLKALLRTIGESGEEASGIAFKTPGALEAIYKDPSILLAKGKKAASELYEAGKAKNVSPVLAKMKEIPDKMEYVTTARKLAQKKVLGRTEALEARKALDGIKNRVRQDYYVETRKMLDDIVKESKEFSAADTAFKRGAIAENIRKIFPQNKTVGASPFRIFTGMQMLDTIPGAKYAVAPLLSPLVQGTAAASAGVASKGIGPVLGALQSVPGAGAAVALSRALELFRRKK